MKSRALPHEIGRWLVAFLSFLYFFSFSFSFSYKSWLGEIQNPTPPLESSIRVSTVMHSPPDREEPSRLTTGVGFRSTYYVRMLDGLYRENTP